MVPQSPSHGIPFQGLVTGAVDVQGGQVLGVCLKSEHPSEAFGDGKDPGELMLRKDWPGPP